LPAGTEPDKITQEEVRRSQKKKVENSRNIF
jgi:hypothetical protein